MLNDARLTGPRGGRVRLGYDIREGRMLMRVAVRDNTSTVDLTAATVDELADLADALTVLRDHVFDAKSDAMLRRADYLAEQTGRPHA